MPDLAAQRKQYRALIILGLAALVDALKNETVIEDDGMAVQTMISGAQGSAAVMYDVANGK